jgi:hypothetical protein
MKIKKWKDLEYTIVEEIEDMFIDFKDIGFDVKILKPDESYYNKFGVYKCSLRIFGWISSNNLIEMGVEITNMLKDNISRLQSLVDNISIRRYDISNMKLDENGQISPNNGLDVKISINFDIK